MIRTLEIWKDDNSDFGHLYVFEIRMHFNVIKPKKLITVWILDTPSSRFQILSEIRTHPKLDADNLFEIQTSLDFRHSL